MKLIKKFVKGAVWFVIVIEIVALAGAASEGREGAV
jgi:hypothetical protein